MQLIMRDIIGSCEDRHLLTGHLEPFESIVGLVLVRIEIGPAVNRKHILTS
jgi:hypothetical protein